MVSTIVMRKQPSTSNECVDAKHHSTHSLLVLVPSGEKSSPKATLFLTTTAYGEALETAIAAEKSNYL